MCPRNVCKFFNVNPCSLHSNSLFPNNPKEYVQKLFKIGKKRVYPITNLGETMAVSTPEKEVLQRFAKYVFRREAAEIREDLYESVVEMVLHLKKRRLDRKTIRNEIKHKLGLEFNQFIVNSAIDRLANKGLVKQKNEEFYLTYPRRSMIDETIMKRKEFLRKIERKFISEYHAKIKTSTPEQDKMAFKCLYAFLSKLFSSEGKLLLAIIGGSKEDIEFVRQYEPPKIILVKLLVEVKDEESRKAIQDSIISIFNRNETIQLLTIVARNYLYFHLLNLDPECRLFQKELFSKKVLLLDTNFIMKLLLISESGHQAAVRCAVLSRELGIQLKFTKRTKQEFLGQLRESNDRLRKLKITRTDTLSSLDDNFIASYALEKQKNPILKWNDFFYRFRTFEAILRKRGITEYKEALPPFEVYRDGLEGPVTGYVLTCWKSLTGGIKHVEVAEHDCYHLLLVRKLREVKPTDTLGPQFWFLTFDSSLLCVDNGINKIIGSKYDLPSSIECWAWMELITPYLAPKVLSELGVEVFSDLMKTQLSLLPARISTKKLIAVQTPKVNFDLFPPEQVKTILSDQFVEEHWNRLVNAELTRSPTVKEHQEQLQERVEDVAKEILMERTRAEVITRYVAAAMSILTLIFALHCVLIRDYTGTIFLGILTTVLIAIAVGYSTIEVSLKKMYAKITRF